MPVLSLPPGPASLLFGVIGGVIGFFVALLLKNRIQGRYSILITASVAGIVAELLSGALAGLTGSNLAILTSRLIGLFTGGAMFRFTYRGHFGPTKDWMGPYLASSFASWTAFAMSRELIGLVAILSAIIGGFLASSLSKAVSKYLPSTVEQAATLTQVTGLSWLLGFVAYSLGIVVIYTMSGTVMLTQFGIFAASSVALLLSFIIGLPYVSNSRVQGRLTARIGTLWRYNVSFILLFLFVSLLVLVGYQKSFSATLLLIAVASGLVAGLVSGSLSYYLSKERKGFPPETFSAVLLGVSTGQGIGVLSSLSLDTALSSVYPIAVLELVLVSGLAATIAGFLISVIRVSKKPPPVSTAPPVEEAATGKKDDSIVEASDNEKKE